MADERKGYREGKWKDHINYECESCQFSTLDLEKMKEHLVLGDVHKHAWAYPAMKGGGQKQ